MDKPILYIAGKVSGLPDLNKPKFEAATRELRARGFYVKNPHEVCHGRKPDDWIGCMRECIKVLMDCDVVILLDDYKDSIGATLEFTIASALQIRCVLYEAFINELNSKIEK
ncbi:uncharacterized protein DUF4406 [Arcticibacter tournemirensis]|uniref:DUF4406 domain-containing protein n=1 Tax=Arcticibacter tournemirensis TaxID=699437 RepID=A0A5M9HFN6_9SPHI|nr:DUF4406 domain-containing protein [Arcticibacter tournemirensis]KAA8483737.1 DUF4406 domain-containing protein [Arcticibacter tournemirensis]TQM50066.1 uncharacterized protein DUF4406 [Arcticibacter tournemirensis]